MFKKILSFLVLIAIFSLFLPITAFAVAPTISNLVVAPNSFNPAVATADISFDISANGFITVEIFDGGTLKKTLINNENLNGGAYTRAQKPALAWDGTDSNNQLLPNLSYLVRVSSREFVASAVEDTEFDFIEVNSPNTMAVNTFTVIPSGGGATFDPSPSGVNDNLEINYTLSQVPVLLTAEIKNSDNDLIRTFSSTVITNTFVWDGEFASKLVLPGIYSVTLTATKAGQNAVVSTRNFTVAYNNANKGEISNFSVAPSSFDPDVEDMLIEFRNTEETNLTVEIQEQDDDVIQTFAGYQNDDYSANDSHSVVWNGKNTSNSQVSVGNYKVVVISRNDYGVVVAENNVAVDNSGGTISSSNSHIASISFSPSSTYEPTQDDDLEIEYDIKKDLDELKIFAVRGSARIELLDESDISADNNLQIYWDGTDDDGEYATRGTWRIQFESKEGSTNLVASKSIEIDYEKPQINDLYVSKNKFDNDIDEFTYILFKTDADANVTIEVLQDNVEDDEVVEDMDVEADKWYAVQWDGGNYDYEDDLDLKLTAKNTVNDDIFDTAKISIDLAEDSVANNKSNVTRDYISPVVTAGREEMTLYYDIEDQADVTITIHKGKSSSGTKVMELLNVDDQEEGGHSVSWDGREGDGDVLSKGLYTYKIVSKTNSTDTETGLFVVGTVGNVEGSGGSGGGSSGSSGSSGGSNVVVDGRALSSDDCGSFSDVSGDSRYCDAIDWAQEENIFQGYPDGTFGEFRPVNRAEILKIILEALNISISSPVAGNLGFTDVASGAWYMPYISTGKNLGIFRGDGSGSTARPEYTVNRVEALKLLFETLRVARGHQVSICGYAYPDVVSGSGAWYYNYVCEAKRYALFDLLDGVNFNPGAPSTRGEMAELLYRLHNFGLL